MAKVVVFGVVAADVVLRLPTLPRPGEQVTGEALGWRVGGSSANIACGLSSAGHDVRLVGPVGNDRIGDELVGELHRWGVDTSAVFRVPYPSPRALILLDHAGERAVVGLESGSSRSGFMPEIPPRLSTVDCIYVETYERYPASISASAGSVLLVTSPPVAGATSWPADIVVGSDSQYRDAGLSAPYQGVVAVAGPRLRWTVVTRGEHGADAYSAQDHVHVPASPATQVDATGAGDAFAAGLIHGLLRGASIAAAMDFGVAWGAEAVTRLQSLPPSWAEVLAARNLVDPC